MTPEQVQQHAATTTAVSIPCAHCDETGLDPDDAGYWERDETGMHLVRDNCPECSGETYLILCRTPCCTAELRAEEAAASDDLCEDHAAS